LAAAAHIADPLPAPPQKGPRRFAVGASLLRAGVVAPEEMLTALSHQGREAGRLPDVLRTRGLVVERDLLGVDARNYGIQVLDFHTALPDPRLIDAVGVQDCLRHGLVPWQKVGAVTVVATSRPEDFHRIRPMLEDRLGPVAVGIASAREILTAIHARRGDRLAHAAENRVAPAESCRNWPRPYRSPRAMIAIGLIVAALVLAPLATGLAALALAVLTLACLTALKIAATIAALRAPLPGPEPASDAIPPVVSIIVALYNEADIARSSFSTLSWRSRLRIASPSTPLPRPNCRRGCASLSCQKARSRPSRAR
jgi:glycosyltransferase XagB